MAVLMSLLGFYMAYSSGDYHIAGFWVVFAAMHVGWAVYDFAGRLRELGTTVSDRNSGEDE